MTERVAQPSELERFIRFLDKQSLDASILMDMAGFQYIALGVMAYGIIIQNDAVTKIGSYTAAFTGMSALFSHARRKGYLLDDD